MLIGEMKHMAKTHRVNGAWGRRVNKEAKEQLVNDLQTKKKEVAILWGTNNTEGQKMITAHNKETGRLKGLWW